MQHACYTITLLYEATDIYQIYHTGNDEYVQENIHTLNHLGCKYSNVHMSRLAMNKKYDSH
jgi:hypothetical protein